MAPHCSGTAIPSVQRACAELLYSTFAARLPASLKTRKYGWKKVTIPWLMPEPEDIEFTAGQALCSLVGLAFSAAYALKRHFLLNNGLGLSYSIEVRFVRAHV